TVRDHTHHEMTRPCVRDKQAGEQAMLRHRLPIELAGLEELSLDLRWVWSHQGDSLWSYVDEELWETTHNPWLILQNLTDERVTSLLADPHFRAELDSLLRSRRQHLSNPGWFRGGENAADLRGIA